MNDPLFKTDRAGHRAFDRMFGAMLVGIGALIAGLCGTCTLFVLGTRAEGYGVIAKVLAPVVGGIPTMVGLAIALFGWSVHLRATPRREQRAARFRDMAVGIARIGFGGPAIWLSGMAVFPVFRSVEEHGGWGAIESENIGEIAFAALFLAVGGWLIVTGVRRALGAK